MLAIRRHPDMCGERPHEECLLIHGAVLGYAPTRSSGLARRKAHR
jgi:hypothetical protein